MLTRRATYACPECNQVMYSNLFVEGEPSRDAPDSLPTCNRHPFPIQMKPISSEVVDIPENPIIITRIGV